MGGIARFIIGRSGSGKTHHVFGEIVSRVESDPIGPPIFLIVPDQAQLLFERQIAAVLPGRVNARVHVAGFTGFGQAILEDAGRRSVLDISPAGRRMLLARLLQRDDLKLELLAARGSALGAVDAIDEALAELESSGRDLDQLEASLDVFDPADTSTRKLRELITVARAYGNSLGTGRLDPHRRQREVLSAIRESPAIRSAAIFVDAIHTFRPIERAMLAEAAAAGADVSITLLLDPTHPVVANHSPRIVDEDPFRRTADALRRLREAFAAVAVETAPPLLLTKNHRHRSPELRAIESHFTIDDSTPTLDHSIELQVAPDIAAEANAVARQIVDLARSGVRFRDIVVLARDLSPYAAEMESAFAAHRIPFFLDRPRPASNHPLFQAVSALLELAGDSPRGDALITLIKTGLAGFDRPAADAAEIHLLSTGLDSLSILREPAWNHAVLAESIEHDSATVAAVVRAAALLRHTLRDLRSAKRATAAEFVSRLRAAIRALGMFDRVAQWSTAAAVSDHLSEAAEYRQASTDLEDLLDEMSTLLGDDPLDFNSFSQLLCDGIRRFEFAIVPPTLDQVIVGGVDRTRVGPVRFAFVLGLSDGVFPKRIQSASILRDIERTRLDSAGIELTPDTRRRQFDELLLGYIALTTPSETLFLSRCEAGDEGVVDESSLVRRIESIVRVERRPIEPDSADAIATPSQLIESTMRACIDADSLKPPFDVMYGWLHSPASLKSGAFDLARKAWRSLSTTNDARLPRDLVSLAFADPFETSVSRLESFAACPFQHFATHILRLRERPRPEVDQAEYGSAFHEIFESLGTDWPIHRNDAARKQFTARAKQLVASVGTTRPQLLALSDPRRTLVLDRMQAEVRMLIDQQQAALEPSGLQPAAVELQFGTDAQAPIELLTPGGRRLRLRGRIDRVDLAGSLAAIIDYKSKATGLNYQRLALGLSLQLISYPIALRHAGEPLLARAVQPIAALLVGRPSPSERIDHPSNTRSAGSARGVVNGDFIEQVRAFYPKKTHSISEKKIKDGEPLGGDLLRADVFDAVIAFAESLLGELADEIVDGDIRVRPYYINGKTPCGFCPARCVCRFDKLINDYEIHAPVSNAVALKQIIERGSKQ